MDDFSAHLKTVQRMTIFFLSFCFMGWAVLPAYRVYFAGLILGTVVSMINSRYLAWKIEQLTKAVVEKSNRKVNLGFITRASVSLLAVLMAYKYEQQVAFSTTLAGLFFVQMATLLLGIISTLKARKK
ncbi:ATP synthase subunit I [Paenibacillus doosanensis]|uniref:ATP synthase I chain n=1 Tax=Paenibacillus konkukensis TaxID=2020716 RepID=A0ABY4RQG0_9BACL|nr:MULTISPECIES: ATP synthase subunit I [Paenibacillus]MCS7460005.1 ATP synthase subunit I [Paenibacillus doosanensis]UQZ84450.1 ATP synthase I chain [Paenibacillus konkukensis]